MAANQQANMLLSMLNSAGMGSSPPVQQQQQQPSGQSHQPYQGFSPANGTGWAPPSSQPPFSNPSSPPAMSSSGFPPSAPFAITDLFKKIEVASPLSPSAGAHPADPRTSASPPPPTESYDAGAQARATSPLGPGANGGGPDQATMLLEMFKQMVPNPKGTAGFPAELTPTSPPPGLDQKQALLNVFQQSGENGLPREPVITHEKPAPSTAAEPAPQTAQSPPPPSVEQPQASAPAPQEPPKKSMFDFVSPFDAFERIPRRVVSKTATPVPTEEPAPGRQLPAAAVSAQVKNTPELTSPAVAVPSSSRAPSNAATSRNASPAPAASQDDESSPATQSGAAAASAPSQTSKPIVSPTHSQSAISTDNGAITISLDTGSPDLLRVEDSAAVQIQPISIMKSVEPPQTAGRTMGITRGWMSYPMKTRLRLIDRSTGARLAIPVPQGSQVVDLATTERHIAFVTSDGNVSVYEVPASWTSDDPPCSKIAFIESSDPVAHVTQNIGKPQQVEWTRKNGQAGSERLVIGGDKGVVLVDVFGDRGPVRAMADIVQNSKVLTTEGDVVGFAFNQTHQVMALLSDSWHLSLYNMATQNRVWHRHLSSSALDSKPSSIAFCETNVLIGANDNQVYDLVQISPGPAVITRLQTPMDEAAAGRKHAIYDSARSILWIGRAGREGMLALRYLLKGKPPVQVAQGETAQAFSRPIRFPLQEGHSFELDRTSDNSTSALLLRQHSGGYLQATINLETAATLFDEAAKPIREPPQEPASQLAEEMKEDTVSEPEQEEAAQEQAAVVGETKATEPVAEQPAPVKEATASSTASSPARPNKNKKNAGKHTKGSSPSTKIKVEAQPSAEVSTIAEVVKVETAPASSAGTRTEPAVEASPQQPSVAVGLDESAVQQMFEKMRSALATQTSEVMSSHVDGLGSRIDAIGGDKLANEISSKIGKDLESSIETALQAQIKATVVPALQLSITSDVQLAVTDATKSLPRNLSQQLLPAIQREVTNTVDKAIEKALSTRLAPAVDKAMAGIKAELKEMMQLKAEMAARAEQPAPVTDPVMEQVAKDIAALGQQMAALQAQLSRQAAPAGPPSGNGPMLVTGPPVNQLPSGSSRPPSVASMGFTPAPPPPQMPQPPADFQDRVTAACSQQHNQSPEIYKLVHDFWAYTIIILPSRRDGPNAPTTTAYISQVLLLTLLHRLSAAMAEWPRLSTLAPKPGMMPLLVDWTKRAAELLDTTDPVLRKYWPSVRALILSELAAVSQQSAVDPRDLSEIVNIVQGKQ